ncbi:MULTISPECIES: MlaD family protein [unclassified Iodidimonas]|jgi:phospholipid/cholesterol/gamma-HCH transport system substrate-binding protein|uniref:MlaD family protein n=1 Tax=unclassified Iodidimonas TaxID=2626145 RepID=UPI00248217BD|nr:MULTISPECIES: MlaD family protein [unclassified Iodidimonas]
METRAHHLLIGLFMLLMIGGLFAFVIWLAKVDVDQQYTRYEIFFEGSVAGLNEGSAVRLNGVPVGSVLDISIPRADPSKVRVLVRIESDVPILDGSMARLELQGFTGIAFVQISGGQEGEDIRPLEGRELAEIPSERSPIQQVFEEAPNLINEAILVVNNIKQLLGPETQMRVATILQNIEMLSGELAARADGIDAVLVRVDEAVRDFQQTAQAFTRLAETTDGLMQNEVRGTFAEASEMARSADALADELTLLVADNREGVSRFVNTGLPEVARMIGDLRRLTLRLNMVVQKFEDRPIEALFGGQQPEYRGDAK